MHSVIGTKAFGRSWSQPKWLSQHDHPTTLHTLQSGKAVTLARWMKKAVASGIYGMKRFVRKLNHDLAAVKNALRESWSNGPVEGHINRLKTLKRQMYGRAGFELLRARLLPVSRGSPLHRK